MGLVVRNYMLVKAKEVTFVQLIRLLFSSRLKNIGFIDCSGEEGEKLRDFKFKIVLIASAIVQKLLDVLREPISKFGNAIEALINLIAANGGLFQLIKNALTGNIKPVPDIAPKLLGNLDTRVDLDENIKPLDEKYNGALAMMASKLAYEKADFVEKVVKENWNMKFVKFYNFYNATFDRDSTPAFICQDKESDATKVVVAFRGTDPFDADNWSTDIDLAFYELEGVGNVHRGFLKALGLRLESEDDPGDAIDIAYFGIIAELLGILDKSPKAEIIVTGHSLGAALALLFAAGLIMNRGDDDDTSDEAIVLRNLAGVYTYGQPRIGDEVFARFVATGLERYNVTYRRYVYCNDVVPRIPFDDNSFEYKHFGKCYYFDRNYTGEVLPEAPNKNYFDPKFYVPMFINAVMELIRSFTIEKEHGSEYKENGLQILFRLFGLIIPGLSAHGPQDYVNLTRLGSAHPSGPEHSIEILIP